MQNHKNFLECKDLSDNELLKIDNKGIITGENKAKAINLSTDANMATEDGTVLLRNTLLIPALRINNTGGGYGNYVSNTSGYGSYTGTSGSGNYGNFIANSSSSIGQYIQNNTGAGNAFQIRSTNSNFLVCDSAASVRVSIKPSGVVELRQNTKNFLECKTLSDVGIFRISNKGYIHNQAPHLWTWYTDSAITVALTQNVWTLTSNPIGRTSFPKAGLNYEAIDWTMSRDTFIVGVAGDYKGDILFNNTGTTTKVYQYRVLQRNGGTTYVRYQGTYDGTGTTVVRCLPIYAENCIVGTRIWSEVRSTSISPGNITIIGSWVNINATHLDY
jgi:hypothetical protein